MLSAVSERLHVEAGETTADGKVTLEFAECLGACDGAPCILVNDDCHMNMTADSVSKLIQEL